jgi:hypothetical protein
MIAKIEITSEVLGAIYSAASAKLMDVDELLINVKDGKYICYQRNAEGSGMFMYESEVFEGLKDLSVQIPIYSKDVKTILSLIKKDKAELEVGQGETVFKFGKMTKKFPQPAEVKVPSKIPSLEPTTAISLSENNVDVLADSFSDIKGGDIKITSDKEKVHFSAQGDIRTTSMVFEVSDVVSYSNNKQSMSGFDKEMLVSIFKAKKDGGTYLLEMGNDTALKFTQDVPKIGKTTFFIAQKIYD